MAEHHPLRTPSQNPTNQTYANLNTTAETRAKQCRTAAMPSLKHLKMADYDKVYEPSDDTYLLLDAIGFDLDLMEEIEKIEQTEEKSETSLETNPMPRLVRSKIRHTLELGCGTGVPTVYLAGRLLTQSKDGSESDVANNESSNSSDGGDAGDAGFGDDGEDCVGSVIHHVTDINPEALRIATETAHANNIHTIYNHPPPNFHATLCDLATPLLEKLSHKIDILIFNPPYVPTPDDEVGSMGIEASWAGGTNGRLVLDRALPQIARLLSYPRGVAYVVTVDDNFPQEIGEIMEERYGVKVVPFLRRRARNEFLTVLKMWPTRRPVAG